MDAKGGEDVKSKSSAAINILDQSRDQHEQMSINHTEDLVEGSRIKTNKDMRESSKFTESQNKGLLSDSQTKPVQNVFVVLTQRDNQEKGSSSQKHSPYKQSR